MNKKLQVVQLTIVLLLVLFGNAHAYKQVTHSYIVTSAVSQSVLSNQDEIKNVVTIPLLKATGYKNVYPGVDASILFLFGKSVDSEDEGARAFHHFYNPSSGIGLAGYANSPACN